MAKLFRYSLTSFHRYRNGDGVVQMLRTSCCYATIVTMSMAVFLVKIAAKR